MPEPELTITDCHACGNAMDVSAVAPFSNVKCPTCGKLGRVKREFGHYTLSRRLAEGGMSLVFVAMDNTLGREVALKILNEDYSADERRIQAFEEEARITASFTHPNVVRVFTTGRAFGRFYIAMEFVPGGHFEHQIRERGVIPESEILPFAVQVAEGLEAARAAGLIHRDVKPGNILLDSRGNAKIVDFGLALVTKGGKATAQEIWATPYYVPPETIEGHAEDFRSDLYAFGATLYHALAGKPSCDEQSMATDVLRQAKRHVKSLRAAAPDVSDETCAIIDRAMAHDPQARYGSYQEMIDHLKVAATRLRNGDSESASGRIERRAAARRGEQLAVAVAGLALLAAVIAGVFWVMRDGPPAETSAAVPIPAQSAEIIEETEAATLIGRRYREAREAVDAGDFQKAREGFAALREDDAVQEPTRTWAAIEAVAAAYLDGRSGEAKKEATAAAEHIRSTPLAEENRGKQLLETLDQLHRFEPARVSTPHPGDEIAWTIATFLGGLKNWEQGLTALATADFFTPVSTVPLKPKDQWANSYQKIAKTYLTDAQLLQDPVFETIPEDKAACVSASERLESLLKQAKTRGRIHFNIRALQLDLARKVKLLDEAKPEPVLAAEPESALPAVDPIVKIGELWKACKFNEVEEFVKSLAAEPEGASRQSLLAINSSVSGFLQFVELEISASRRPISLKLRSGEALENVKITGRGKLSSGGKEFGWGEIDSGSIIDLYRNVIRIQVPENDQLTRHEGAIAYDWLIGDRVRATAAADRLALDSPLFKRRWDSMISGLPK